MKTIALIFGCALAALAQDSQQQQIVIQKDIADAKAALQSQTFAFVGGQIFNGNPVKGQPYSAEAVTETTQTLADGNKIVTRSSTMIYRDSDGRERREETIGKLGNLNAANPSKVVFISDPVAKVSYTLHTQDKTAEKIPAPPGGEKGKTFFYSSSSVGGKVVEERILGPDAPVTVRTGPGDAVLSVTAAVEPPAAGARRSAKTEQLGTQTIEGIPADGTRTTTTIPAGQIGNERDINIVNERWYSQELGVVVKSVRSDPRSGETVYKLTNVNRTEPLHSLFEIPSDYNVFDAGSLKVRTRQEEQ